MIEYAFREANGTIIEKDTDDELRAYREADDYATWAPAVDPTPDELERIRCYAVRNGLTLMSRTLPEPPPFVVHVDPLPTTPGSVVEKDGGLYGLGPDGDSRPWRSLGVGGSPAGWASGADLAGAKVLFDAGATAAG